MPIIIDVSKSALYQEGVEETKIQAIKGLLRLGKFSIKDIAEGLEVTEQYVLEVKESLESKP